MVVYFHARGAGSISAAVYANIYPGLGVVVQSPAMRCKYEFHNIPFRREKVGSILVTMVSIQIVDDCYSNLFLNLLCVTSL